MEKSSLAINRPGGTDTDKAICKINREHFFPSKASYTAAGD